MANGEYSRKQPWDVAVQQPWASEIVEASHTEALWIYGENCLYTMLWRPQDFEAGLVGRCTHCYDRGAAAFKQPGKKKCEFCYGTLLEGGIRAQIVRPTLVGDRNIERTDTIRGTVDIDSIQMETTADFYCTKGDYVFRADGSRYQVEQKGEAMLHTGFGYPDRSDSFRGTIPTARLEDPTSVAYIVPPDTDDLITLLSGPPNEQDLFGGTGSAGLPADTTMREFVFNNLDVWTVPHNLGLLVPGTVTVTDLDNHSIMARVDYATTSQLVIRWPGATSGKVYVKR